MNERRKGFHMKHTITLTVSSLLTILFATFHLADDIVRGFASQRGDGRCISGRVSFVGAVSAAISRARGGSEWILTRG